MRKIFAKIDPKKHKKRVKRKVLKKWNTALMKMHEDTLKIEIEIVSIKNLKNKI